MAIYEGKTTKPLTSFNRPYVGPMNPSPKSAYRPSAKAKAPAPRRAPAPSRASTPTRNYAPAAARRVVSGKSVGSNSQGRITPIAPPKPKPPMSIDQWLAGDSAYKQQTDAAMKSLNDYRAQMTGQQNNYNIEEARNKGDLADQQKLAESAMTDDYASRGLSQSGLALKAFADLATDYDKRNSALDQGAAEFTGNANTGLQNFQSTQGINATKYKNDAISRRALKFNLP